MPSYDFNGQVALVTGGGSGIGRATSLLLAKEGANVVVTDIDLEAAHHTLTLMSNRREHMAVQMDVTQHNAVKCTIGATRERFGKPPNLLVNSAGIGLMSPFLEITQDQIDKLIDINLKGTILVSQTFINALLKEPHSQEKEKGVVVNLSSMSGKTGLAGMALYASTKAGVIAFSKSCAAEMARKGIRVNCVLPALIETPMIDGIPKELHQSYTVKNPLGRMGKPEEVADVIMFLLSRQSSYMVGACVEVSGGTDM